MASGTDDRAHPPPEETPKSQGTDRTVLLVPTPAGNPPAPAHSCLNDRPSNQRPPGRHIRSTRFSGDVQDRDPGGFVVLVREVPTDIIRPSEIKRGASSGRVHDRPTTLKCLSGANPVALRPCRKEFCFRNADTIDSAVLVPVASSHVRPDHRR